MALHKQLYEACSKDGSLDKVKVIMDGVSNELERQELLHWANPEDVSDLPLAQMMPRHHGRCTQLNKTALHEASWHGHADIASYLLEAGANFEARDGVSSSFPSRVVAFADCGSPARIFLV